MDFLGPCLHERNFADCFRVSQQSGPALLRQFVLVLWWGLMLSSGMFLLFCFLCCCCVGCLFVLQTEEHLRMNRDCGEEDVFSSASTSEGSLDVSTNVACRCYCIPIKSLNNQKPLLFLMLSQVEVAYLAGLVMWAHSLCILMKLKCNALLSKKNSLASL